MNWTSDPELQQMFLTELEERSGRLLEGARAMQRGEADDELAGAMLREGHTIKGTSRVMGFEALSRTGQLIEQLWRSIQHGDMEPHAELGEALEAVALAIPGAVNADPTGGTDALAKAIAMLTNVGGHQGDAEAAAVGSPSPAGAVPEAPPQRVAEPRDGEAPAPVPAVSEPVVPGPVVPESPEVPQAVEPAEITQSDEGPAGSGDVIPLRPDVAMPVAAPSRPRFAAEDERAELGGLVGAVESWAAEQTMAVNAGKLYRLINEIAGIRNELDSLRDLLPADHPAIGGAAGLSEAIVELQHDALGLAAIPLSGMTNSLPQLVRYLAKKLDKDVRFELVSDDDIAVDRQVIDTISDPVRQLIVNAIRHGIEPPQTRTKIGKPQTGSLSMTAAVKDRRLEIVITDDGAGVDWETVRTEAIQQGLYPADGGVDVDGLRAVLFAEGFSTVTPSDLGGDGRGLSTVAAAVEALFGRIKLESTAGVGATVSITVPTSRALQRVVLVEEAGSKWGLPEAVVDEVLPARDAAVDWSSPSRTIEWQGRALPVVPFGELTGAATAGDPTEVVIMSHRLGEFAFTAERVIGTREVAVKELGPLLSGPSHISGAALLGGGDVVLVLDAGRLFDRLSVETRSESPRARVLVVDDSLGARAVVSGALASSGFTTSVASSVAEALEILGTEGADAVVVDFSMPQEDGIALVDEVRANYSNLPVVMLSGVATPEDQARAKEAGVDAFFEKADFREGALADTLRKMLDVKRNTG